MSMYDQQRNASLLASPSADGVLRGVYILPGGRHGALRSVADYVAALKESFPFFLEVRECVCGGGELAGWLEGHLLA
jgi:hypothetical protein